MYLVRIVCFHKGTAGAPVMSISTETFWEVRVSINRRLKLYGYELIFAPLMCKMSFEDRETGLSYSQVKLFQHFWLFDCQPQHLDNAKHNLEFKGVPEQEGESCL